MMRLTWCLVAQDGAVVRHCHGCGRPVPFTFSMHVRRNARGKTLHVYEIYKCPNEHTWNRKVAKARETRPDAEPPQPERCSWDVLLRHGGADIRIEHHSGNWRLAKTLVHHIEGLSRSRVLGLITTGQVQVNGAPATEQQSLRNGDRILLLPEAQEAAV